MFAGVWMAVGLALIHTACERLKKAMQGLMKFCLASYPDSIAAAAAAGHPERAKDPTVLYVILYIIIIQTLVTIPHASQRCFPGSQLIVVQRLLSQKWYLHVLWPQIDCSCMNASNHLFYPYNLLASMISQVNVLHGWSTIYADEIFLLFVMNLPPDNSTSTCTCSGRGGTLNPCSPTPQPVWQQWNSLIEPVSLHGAGVGEVNLLSFRTEYSMEKTKESQDAPQRDDDINGVVGNRAASGVPGWANTWERCWITTMNWGKFLGWYVGLIAVNVKGWLLGLQWWNRNCGEGGLPSLPKSPELPE